MKKAKMPFLCFNIKCTCTEQSRLPQFRIQERGKVFSKELMAPGQSPGDPNIHLPQSWDGETRTSIPENCYKEQTQFQRTDLFVKSGNTPIKLGEKLGASEHGERITTNSGQEHT